jgi:O-antigen ligase
VILLTQSRGVFLGLVSITVLALLQMLGKPTRRAIGVALVFALIIYLAVPVDVWERLYGIEKLTSASTIAEADSEGSAAERFEILKVGWQIFRDNPFFGVGLGAYPLANAMYVPDLGKRDTHNTYLNLAAEVGLPGLMLWCIFLGSVLRHAYRSQRNRQALGLVTQQVWIVRAFVGYLVAGLFGTYAALTFPYLILATLWCSANLLSPSSSLYTKNAKSRLQGKL